MTYDYIVLGAGIAGASCAYELLVQGGKALKVLLLEREDSPGYHSTGRSAALYSETYGHPVISGLTRLSRPFFDHPPQCFGDQPLLTSRGVMLVGGKEQATSVRHLFDQFKHDVEGLKLLSRDEALALNPVLRPDLIECALLESRAKDMDVNAIHQGYLRGVRALGGEIVSRANVSHIEWIAGTWRLTTGVGGFGGGVLINAAGAWADEVAMLAGLAPLGLVPKRRTAFTFEAPTDVDMRACPMVVDVDEAYYFKPESGVILGSPADETPVPPCDVQPEELDIAIAVDKLQTATTLEIKRILTKWAGLRTFAPDKVPVVGPDRGIASFFWLAGQGGYGIMTAPAMAQASAALALGASLPDRFTRCGVTPDTVSPRRFN